MLTDPLTPAYLIKIDWISAEALFLDKSTKSIPMKIGLYITWPQWDSGRLCHRTFWQRTWYCNGSDSNKWLNAIKKLGKCYFNIFSSLSLQTKHHWILQYFLPLNRKGWYLGSKYSCLNTNELDYRPLKRSKCVYTVFLSENRAWDKTPHCLSACELMRLLLVIRVTTQLHYILCLPK